MQFAHFHIYRSFARLTHDRSVRLVYFLAPCLRTISSPGFLFVLRVFCSTLLLCQTVQPLSITGLPSIYELKPCESPPYVTADMTDTFLLKLTAAVGLLSSSAMAHGYVQGIVADNMFYSGYRPSFQYLSSPPQVPGWSDPQNLNNGFINDYTSPDIICHLDATPGQAYATVQAGGSVQLQWTPWPVGHLGPVITYLANCNGDCTTVDKTKLLFNKIDEAGLIQGGYSPGKWGASELIADNNSWTVQIPSDLASGNYVLRHEIIALQEAMSYGGAQNYPQCVNIKVTGSGTNSMQSGTLGTSLYTHDDPGIHIDIYQALSNYTIPGPPLVSDASSPSQPIINTTSSVASPITSTTSLMVNTSSSTTTSTSLTTYTSTSTSSAAAISSSSSSLNVSLTISATDASLPTTSTTSLNVTTPPSTSSTTLVTLTTTSLFSNGSSTSTVTATETSFVTASISITSSSTAMLSNSSPLVFATIPLSISSVTTSAAALPTTFQTFTTVGTSTSSQETSTSTEVVTFTVTVPGVFAAPSTLSTMYSSPSTTATATVPYYPTNGTSWNGTTWSSGTAWASGTAWSSGTAPSSATSTTYQTGGTSYSWYTVTTNMPSPIENGYRSKRSMRIARRGNLQKV